MNVNVINAADWFEEIAVRAGGRPVPLSEPSKTWIDRMWRATVAGERGEISEAEWNETDKQFIAYLRGLENQHEAELANGVFFAMLGVLKELGWPMVKMWEHALVCPGQPLARDGGRA